MTEKANPSRNRPAEAFKTAGAIAYGGHGSGGFVVGGGSPTDISTQDAGIDETVLNTFAETSSASSFDVTIDPGEAFVFGSWIAIDVTTTVTLATSTAGQTVYVGWNKNGADDVIVGLAADFSDASGDTDERIPLWTFDTDGSGVTAVTDERQIGKLNTGGVDLQGGSLRDSTQGYVDLTGGDDVRISTDQSIEDGSGNSRIALDSTSTRVRDENGRIHFNATGGVGVQLRPSTGEPLQVEDTEGGFTAVQYTTDATTGTLSLNNAQLDLAGNQITDSTRGFIDLTGDSNDLRLATGQAIEDGGGDGRILLGSNGTKILNDNGGSNSSIEVTGSSGIINQVDSSGPWSIYDSDANTSAVSYSTSTSVGLFDLQNSKLRLYRTSSDPAANPGEMWYRDDLD